MCWHKCSTVNLPCLSTVACAGTSWGADAGRVCVYLCLCCSHKPSGLYSRIKVASELVNASGGLALVTQVVVASKTGELQPLRQTCPHKMGCRSCRECLESGSCRS